jgi:uncharacterized protein
MVAARFGHVGVADLLIQRGAALEARDTRGWTPLWFATWSRQEAVFDLLVKKRADVRATDAQGDPLLPFAADMGAAGIVKRLLAAGVPVDVATKNKMWTGYTASMKAVERGNREILETLIAAGADLGVRNSTGQGLVHESLGSQAEPHPEQLAILGFLVEEKGLPVDQRDNFGRTPLMFAAMNGLVEQVRYLLSRGADWRAKDGRGETSLDMAKAKPEIATVLEQWEKAHRSPP